MKTRARTTRGNTHFRDDDYSPPRGSSLWESYPALVILQDPAVGHEYHNHFHNYVAGDWTVTAVGAGAAATADGAGGLLTLTNAAADDDSLQIQKVGEAFRLASGKPLWYEARLKISDATQSDFLVGLAITDTTLIAANSDGVNFRKADGSTAVSFVTEKDSSETTTAGVHTAANDTFVRLGFFFDGAGTVYGYANGVLVATHTLTVPDDEELRISFAHQNGEAVAKVMTLDYVRVGQIL